MSNDELLFENNSIIYRVDTANAKNNYTDIYNYKFENDYHIITKDNSDFIYRLHKDEIWAFWSLKESFKQTKEELFEQIVKNVFNYINSAKIEGNNRLNKVLNFLKINDAEEYERINKIIRINL